MMKNRKYLTKGLAGVLAAGMIAGGAAGVYASEANDTMTVQYTKQDTSSFVLSIPKTVTLSETNITEAPIAMSEVALLDGRKVEVKVKSGVTGGAVTLTDAESTESIQSTVSLEENGAALADNEVVAEFEGSSTDATQGGTLYFSKLENVQPGNYTGQIVFEAAIVNK